MLFISYSSTSAYHSGTYPRHNGRANILTVGGSVASVDQDSLKDYYAPMTWTGPKHYSVQIGSYMVPDGAKYTPVDIRVY